MRTFEELSEEFWSDTKLEDFENVKSEDYDRYLNELNQIIENGDTDIAPLKLKYFILYCQEKYEESIEVCDYILRKYIDDIETLNDKINSLFQLNRYKECIEICQRILEIDPKNKDAISHWSSAYLMADDSTLPKPPQSLFTKIVRFIIFFAIIAGICYWLLSFYFPTFAFFK